MIDDDSATARPHSLPLVRRAGDHGARARRGRRDEPRGAGSHGNPYRAPVRGRPLVAREARAPDSSHAEQPDAPACITKFRFFLYPGNGIPRGFNPVLLQRDLIGRIPETLLVRREAFLSSIGPFPEGMPSAYDVEWFARLVERRLPLPIVPEVLLFKGPPCDERVRQRGAEYAAYCWTSSARPSIGGGSSAGLRRVTRRGRSTGPNTDLSGVAREPPVRPTTLRRRSKTQQTKRSMIHRRCGRCRTPSIPAVLSHMRSVCTRYPIPSEVRSPSTGRSRMRRPGGDPEARRRARRPRDHRAGIRRNASHSATDAESQPCVRDGPSQKTVRLAEEAPRRRPSEWAEPPGPPASHGRTPAARDRRSPARAYPRHGI